MGTDSTAADGLRMDSFAPGLDPADPAAADSRTRNWFEAVKLGFHEERADPGHLPGMVDAYRRDGRTLTAVYDDEAPEYASDPAMPVATYASMANRLNVGGRALLPAHLITMVTVRPTHRRRGILRRMITSDLAAAKQGGFALAALTASEATIYGRFGFGAASSTAAVELDTRGGLEFTAPPRGTVAVADSGKLLALAPEIFSTHLDRTLGALGRQHGYALRASGTWSEESSEPDKALRGVIRYNADGVPDGYAAYKSLGWRTDPHTMRITDLVAASDEAYRELWRYLGSIDLVERLTFGVAPVEDPLPWMLADRRRYKVTSVEDVLWLRVLDPKAALEARGYAGDGAVVLDVVDPLGFAGGAWLLEVRGGAGRVRPLGAAEDTGHRRVELDAAALGSLYLGAVTGRTLAAAGGVRASEDALTVLDELFAAGPAPYCSTHF
ncbi:MULTISPECIES: GNAT family N-acetyltransferase [unclassified Arthrobacter]|uniref:GNAT family N-acetyltransferase n=1 Tax=unclassified Arthrobacter TaxID=235627 RepID=UPI001E36E6DC|nr:MULTISPECIES: GNAT family N-acetyltransferase [unclassified Arthrobacter]MCC9145335.1 GNAT family N-acetyltransferase [Arthrobacter sp. zg-Y919]MDK1276563.1 GNAT family N-acetyltransferase [Arthrobacter sp. zg.Y919]WIB01846.1 GNAT family N-acetyltransferase [Arthrobacter sp. zg-Y919]